MSSRSAPRAPLYTRLAAVAAAGLVATGAFAAPSAAQDAAEPLPPVLDGRDRAAADATPEARALAAAGPDYTGDGHPDLVAIRKADGALVLYAGKTNGSFDDGSVVATGVGGHDFTMAGDIDGDGHRDLLARDNENGALLLYPGDGAGGFGAPRQVGSGWNKMGVFTTLDWDGDGTVDLLATREGDGRLLAYPGNGAGGFGSAESVGTGWANVDTINTPGDLDGDGLEDFMARNAPAHVYFVYLSGSAEPVEVPGGLGDPWSDYTYAQIAPVGDVDQDGSLDLAAINSWYGILELHSFEPGTGSMREGNDLLGSDWGRNRLAAVVSDRTYDHDQNGASDVVARASNGTTYLYTGTNDGGFGPRYSWGTGMSDLNLMESAGDMDGDGFADVLGRVASDGSLWIHPGDGLGGQKAPFKIGTGWNSMSAIVSGQDFNGDGQIDIIAVEKATGNLYLYPGITMGYVGSRIKIGSGWGAMSLPTAAGDLDSDGHADVVAVRNSDDCMYFYGGRGDGTLKNGVKVGCGWGAVNALVAVGDFQGDGHDDLLARRASDGALFLYPGNANGGFTSAVAVGSGWNKMDLIA